jgi:hypothetical protein
MLEALLVSIGLYIVVSMFIGIAAVATGKTTVAKDLVTGRAARLIGICHVAPMALWMLMAWLGFRLLGPSRGEETYARLVVSGILSLLIGLALGRVARRMASAKEKGVPAGLIVGVVALVLVTAVGVIYKIKSDNEKQLAEQAAEKERAIEERKLRRMSDDVATAAAARARAFFAQKKIFEQTEASLKMQIAKAKSDTERAALVMRLEDARRALHTSGGSRPAAVKEQEDTRPSITPDPINTRKAASLDPLE